MKLIVKNNAGETVSIQIKSNETFMDLKERVEEEAGISLDLKDIALKGKKITETQKVIEYFLSYGEIKEGPQANVFCAVPGCKNTKQDNPEKVFFEFPTEEIRCHQWVLYCQRLNAGPGKKRLNLTSESTICSDHFRPDQFVKNTNTLLKRTAVPCVKMAPQQSTQSGIRRPKRSDSPNLDDFDPKNFFSEDSQDHRDVLPLRLRLCRLCANPFDDFIMIFGEEGRKNKIAEKINLCLPIEVQMTDALPKQICKGCFNHLNELFELADVSSLSQEKLIFSAEFGSSTEDLGLSSLDDPGEDEIVGETSSSKGKEKSDDDGCCPLCKEGKLELLPKIKTEEPSSAVDSLDDIESLNLGKTNSIDQNEYSFENVYSEPFMKKKSSHIIYDPSDLVSQDDSSTGDFTRETDPLRIDENSKSDNDPIGDFNLTSPLNIMGSEDSSHRNVKNNRLSPIAEELGMDAFPSFDTESETSSTLPLLGDDSDQMLNAYCRICGSEFHSQKDLLKHSFSHSFKGFYQCAECKTTFTQPQDLENHFKTHENEEGNKHHCEVCGKSFKLAISLASHKCSQEEGSHCCYICKKQFKSELKLRNHMKYHEISRPAYCNLCRKIFPDEIKLHKHNMYIHNNKKAHCCEDCGKVFKSEASMRYHQRAHQSDDSSKPYTCERCGKSFIRKTMLMNHMTSSHKHMDFETPCFTCKLCFEAFPSTDAAVAHMDNHHKLECMDESTYSFEMHTINRLFICEFCDRCYAEGSVLNQHREQHPADAPYGCKVCDTTFSTLEEVTRHRAEHVTEEFPDEYLSAFTIPRTYLCEFCERYFLNQVKYNEHLTVHYGPEPYQCRSCSFKFATLAEAQQHRALHVDPAPQNEDYNYYRPYECHYCSKTFAIEDALVKHIRMHTGEKPFICDQCGKGFSQSSGLYTHQKVHSSERPYSCTVCPRTFKIKGDRDVHVRKHSGDRPYKCEFCGKAFMTQHVYSQHRKIHTGERPYKCDVCGIAFRRSHVLTVHKRIHTGEKPNECDICGKRYRQKGDMLKHRRVQHGIIGSKPVVPLVGHMQVC